MSKDGADLEDLAEEIFRTLTYDPLASGSAVVERNVQVPGPDGPRQIDIVIRSSAGPIKLMTIIECKDYSRRVDVRTVDALHSVAQDVKASRGVIVSRGGFSRTAIQKAKRLGIALYTADRMKNVTDEMFQLPIHVRELRPTDVHMSGEVHLEAGDQLGLAEWLVVDGVNVLHLLRDYLVANESLALEVAGQHHWIPPGSREQATILTASGEERVVTNLSLTYTLAERHFFGYLGDLAEAMVFRDDLERHSRVLLKAETLATDYASDFVEFDSADALPVEPALSANVAVVPDPETDLHEGFLGLKRQGP